MSFKTRGPVLSTATQATAPNPSNDGSAPNNFYPDFTVAAVFSTQATAAGATTQYGLNANVPAGSYIDAVDLTIDATAAQAAQPNVALYFNPVGGTQVQIGTVNVPAIAGSTVTRLTLGNAITINPGQAGVFANTGTANGFLSLGGLNVGAGNTLYANVRLVVRNRDGSIGLETPYNLSN